MVRHALAHALRRSRIQILWRNSPSFFFPFGFLWESNELPLLKGMKRFFLVPSLYNFGDEGKKRERNEEKIELGAFSREKRCGICAMSARIFGVLSPSWFLADGWIVKRRVHKQVTLLFDEQKERKKNFFSLQKAQFFPPLVSDRPVGHAQIAAPRLDSARLIVRRSLSSPSCRAYISETLSAPFLAGSARISSSFFFLGGIKGVVVVVPWNFLVFFR